MIQRKQTLFLLLAFLLAVVCLSTRLGSYETSDGGVMGNVYNLFITDGMGGRHFTTWPLMAVLLLSAVLMLLTIFMYRRRPLQSLMASVAALLQVVWYVLFVVITGEGLSMTLSAALPAVCAILCFMARQAIKADEKLVRSMDRIR